MQYLLKNIARSMRIGFWLFFTVMFGFNSAQATTWDINQVYQLALKHDSIYQSEILRHAAVKLDPKIVRSEWKGYVSLVGRLGHQMTDDTMMDNWEDHKDHSLDLRVEVPIYDRVLRTRIRQSQISESTSRIMLRESHQDLILRVAKRYLNVLAAQDRREVASVDIIAIRRQLDLTAGRLEVGLGTQADLFDARARLKQAEANAIQADNALKNSISLLRQMIGQRPQSLTPLVSDAPLTLPDPESIDEWTGQAEETNLNVQVKALDLEFAKFELQKLKDATYPSMSVLGNRSTSIGGVNDYTKDNASINLQVNIPLFTGGLSTRSDQAEILYGRALEALDLARIHARTEATTAYLDINSNISQAEALSEAITAGESALAAKQQGYEAGLTTNIDVLDAQSNLSQSRRDYLNSRYNYIISMLELEQSIGDLDEHDIQLVNDWLDQGV
ncbi:MAG: TolC family outer membrane protein [Gammaproteobacteria bacterium]|nr:TolC family outer membrane protein [Gammaproteobacteria bacterium]